MNWSAIGVILVGIGLIGQLFVKVFGLPKSTGVLQDAVVELNLSIQKLNGALDNALTALETLQGQFKTQWQRIDQHSELLSDMDKEIGLIKARCEWVQHQKEKEKS